MIKPPQNQPICTKQIFLTIQQNHKNSALYKIHPHIDHKHFRENLGIYSQSKPVCSVNPLPDFFCYAWAQVVKCRVSNCHLFAGFNISFFNLFSFFSCQSSSIPTYLTHSERSTRQCAHTSKLEVI